MKTTKVNILSTAMHLSIKGLLIALVWGTFAAELRAEDTLLVVPLGYDFADADNASIGPFFIEEGGLSSMRYQQIYDGSQFWPAPSGCYIRAVSFRKDADPFVNSQNYITNIQINISTTPRVVTNLSSVFAENIGSDDTVVYGPTGLTFPTSSTQGVWLSGRVGFSKPFYYKPSAGNLLMDVRNFTGGTRPVQVTKAFDATTRNKSVARAYAESVTAVTASHVDGVGLVTGFFIYPNPLLLAEVKTNSLVISWSDDAGLFNLESSSQLGGGATWQVVTNQPVPMYGTNFLSLPYGPGTQARYFRLSSKSKVP